MQLFLPARAEITLREQTVWLAASVTTMLLPDFVEVSSTCNVVALDVETLAVRNMALVNVLRKRRDNRISARSAPRQYGLLFLLIAPQ